MSSRPRWVLAFGGCALGLAGACADSLDDGGGDGDAGVAGCSVSLSFSPAFGEIGGAAVTVTARIGGDVEGIRELSWSVRRGSEPIAFDVVATDDTRIAFSPEAAGVHTITADATVGGQGCTAASEAFNVRAQGAIPAVFRVRAVAPPGVAAPGERVFTIYGGADYHVGTLTLDSGLVADGIVRAEAGGVAGPAYLRAVGDGTLGPLTIETFAAADGTYSMNVPPQGTYSLLIVPTFGDLPPQLTIGLSASSLAGTQSIAAGGAFAGTVVDNDGQPLADATVSVSVGGAPSALAVTDAAGAFSLQARSGAPAVVAIVPPAASGLPRLDATFPTLMGGATISAAYAPALDVRQHTFPVVLANGTTPAPGARVTFAAALADAGTITVGAVSLPADGSVRIAAVAGGGGQVTSLALADADYSAVLEPATPGPVPALRLVDLRAGGAVGTLAFRAAGTVNGSLRDQDGAPLSGARITATGRLALANIASAATSAESAADGSFSLPLAATGRYELAIAGAPAAQVASLTTEVSAPAAGQIGIGALELGPTIELTGEVRIVGGAPSATGIQVLLYCESCTDADTPLAIAATDASGTFRLRAPDPGVAP